METLENAYNQFKEARVGETLDYQRFNAYLVTHHSTSIEGSSLTKIETDLLLEKGLTPAGKPVEHSLMVEDHYKALQFVLASAKQKIVITQDFIRNICAMVMARTGDVLNTALGSFDIKKGEYRLVSAYSGSHYYTAYDKIPARMEHLVATLQDRVKTVSGLAQIYQLSFDAHFELVTIHPFGDGNGRTSRLLMNFIQAYHELPLTTVFIENRKEYIESLMKSRDSKSTQPIRRFMTDQAIKYFNQETAYKKKADKDDGLSFVF
ncbi:MAG: Fic family protein [Bacteroidota bacterium]